MTTSRRVLHRSRSHRSLAAVTFACAAFAGAAAPAAGEILFTQHAALGTAVVRLPDGEFLIGGDSGAGSEFAAMKLRSDGRIDTRFGSGGFTQVHVGRSDFNDASSILALRDGRILVSGTVGTDNSVQNGTGTLYGVARLTSAGRLDRSFGSGGSVRFTPFPNNPSDKSEWIAQMPGGRVMVGGDSQPDPDASLEPCAFSFNVDLTPTPGFKPACEQLSGTDADFADAAPGPGGTIVLALHGNTEAISQHSLLGIARLTSTGALDQAFGANGMTLNDFGALRGGLSQTGVSRLRARPGGAWLVAGTTPGGFSFAGYTPAGTLDPRFGSGGKLVVRIGGTKTRNDVLVDVVRLDGGRKFLAVGQTELVNTRNETDLELVRINANGTLDRSFGHGGRALLRPQDLGAPDIAQIDAATDAGSGRVLVVGASHEQRYGVLAVRLSSAGRVDPSFGR